MANKNGRGRAWRDIDIRLLTDYWQERTIEHLSNMLCRSEEAIVRKGRKLGLPSKRRRNATPPDIVEYIKENIGKQPVKELAAELGMPVQSVYTVAYNHDISVKQARKEYQKNKP